MKMSIRHMIVGLVVATMFAASAHARLAYTESLFGNDEQPGHRLHGNIVSLYLNDSLSEQAAIDSAVEKSLEDDSNILNVDAKVTVASDSGLAKTFYELMTEHNSLIEVTKRLVEAQPEQAQATIRLGVALYPDFAQEIYDGVAITGILDSDELTIAMLDANADPALFGEATATGNELPVELPPTDGFDALAAAAVSDDFLAALSVQDIDPLGAGIGGGGTGSGDDTASDN
ncbi:hypothetical protein PN836_017445 [Ningiella sp. W23]|uniref:hypothetical protein n=1 Tax=Ningiella sp. W23 TaxID=3023715 RepID=UPI0037567F6B